MTFTLFMTAFVIVQEPVKATWYDSGFSYNKEVNVTDNILGYVSLINVTNTSGGDVNCSGYANANFSDIRFVLANNTLLPYWIDPNATVAGSYANIWVKNIWNDTTFDMYYGNASALPVSDGFATFDFFDDFDDNSINTSKWNITYKYGNITETNGRMEITNSSKTAPNYGFSSIDSNISYNTFRNGIINGVIYSAFDVIPAVTFKGVPATAINTGYMARFDTRLNQGLSFLKPPYHDFIVIGGPTNVTLASTTWFPFNITVYDDGSNCTMKSEIFNQTKTVVDSTYATNSGCISLQLHYNRTSDIGYTYYDNIRVRPYSSIIPTFAFGPVTMENTVPTVQTNSTTSITSTGATFNGFLSSNGSLDTTCGFRWLASTGPNAGVEHNDSIGIVAGGAPFSENVILERSTHYIIQTWAFNSMGFEWGGGEEFDTPAESADITTNATTGITDTDATFHGYLSDNGSADTVCGFRWGKVNGTWTGNSTVGLVGNASSYLKSVSSLTHNSHYYAQAWGENSIGFAASEHIDEFDTGNWSEITFTQESPTNNTENVSTALAEFTVDMNDHQGFAFSWNISIWTGGSIIATQVNGSDTNGTKTCAINTTLLPSTEYIVIVVADDVAGFSNATLYRFVTMAGPSFTNMTPANETVNLTILPMLNVTFTSYLNCTVLFFHSDNGVNFSITGGGFNVTDTLEIQDNLSVLPAYTYYWYAFLSDSDGNTNTTPTYWFTTAAAHNNVTPAGGAVNVSLSPTLYFNFSQLDGLCNVTWYWLNNSNWTVLGVNESVNETDGPFTQVYSNATATNTTYWWRVNVTNEYGSYYQNTYNFTTLNGVPYVPTCVLPTDGGVNITRRPRLEVLAIDPDNDSLRVDFYLVNYSYLGSMNGSSGHDFYWDYPSSWSPLDYLTGYSWYANVTDYWGATNTSGILNFITRDSITPDKPSQPMPINNSMDQEYAMRYTLRCQVIDQDGDQMNVSIYWNGTLLDTFYNVNSGSFVTYTLPFDLQASTTYPWTVNVTECTGRAYANYSEFTFTTHMATQFWSMSIPQLVFFIIIGLWVLLLVVGEWKDDPMFSCICGVVGLVLVPSELAIFGLSVYTIGLGAAWGILNFYILFLSLIFLIRMIKGRRKR